MIKLSTINQIVEAIIDAGGVTAYAKGNPELFNDSLRIANEAVIYYKTAMICESKGVEAAMEYFMGTHSEDEYEEFRTSVYNDEKAPSE